MDAIDKKILKNLQRNARMTISDLSADISLSMPAISERLKKLEATGVIKQYTVILDPAALNKHLMALMFIRLENPSHSDSFTHFVKHESEITECFYITGEFDYAMKISTENTHTLELLLTRIKNQKGILKTQTLVILSAITDNPSLVID